MVNSRLIDACEIQSEIVQTYARASVTVLAWYWDQDFCGLTGLARMEVGSALYLWAELSEASAKHSVACARAARKWLGQVLATYPEVVGHCSDRTLRWTLLAFGPYIQCLEPDQGMNKYTLRPPCP